MKNKQQTASVPTKNVWAKTQTSPTSLGSLCFDVCMPLAKKNQTRQKHRELQWDASHISSQDDTIF